MKLRPFQQTGQLPAESRRALLHVRLIGTGLRPSPPDSRPGQAAARFCLWVKGGVRVFRGWAGSVPPRYPPWIVSSTLMVGDCCPLLPFCHLPWKKLLAQMEIRNQWLATAVSHFGVGVLGKAIKKLMFSHQGSVVRQRSCDFSGSSMLSFPHNLCLVSSCTPVVSAHSRAYLSEQGSSPWACVSGRGPSNDLVCINTVSF